MLSEFKRRPSTKMALMMIMMGGLVGAIKTLGMLVSAQAMTSESEFCEQDVSQINPGGISGVSIVARGSQEGRCLYNLTKTSSVWGRLDGGTPWLCSRVYCIDSVRHALAHEMCFACQCTSEALGRLVCAMRTHSMCTAGQRCSGVNLETKKGMTELLRGSGWHLNECLA